MNKLSFDPNRHVALLCPCGKSNHDGKFAPFLGYTDKGHCFSCAKNFLVKTEPPIKEVQTSEKVKPKIIVPKEFKISFIEWDVLRQSLGKYNENTFFQYLGLISNAETAEKLRRLYFIGTSKYWQGSAVFWQIDIKHQIRSGKIIQYQTRSDESCFMKLNCGRV